MYNEILETSNKLMTTIKCLKILSPKRKEKCLHKT